MCDFFFVAVCDKSGQKYKPSLDCSSRDAMLIILFVCSTKDKIIPKDTLGMFTVLGLLYSDHLRYGRQHK